MTKPGPNALPLLLLLPLAPSIAFAAGLPGFDSDPQADAWVRKHSASYRSMAEAVDRRGGYSFLANDQLPGGMAYFKDGRGYIELTGALKGSHRVSVLIFELTNLYQEGRHQEVADRVRRGELNNPPVFALLREMIEYDGLRLHLGVLTELQPTLGTVPPEMITWVSSTAKRFADYQLPFAYDYIKAQAAGGHTAHCLKLFEKHRAEYLATLPKGPPAKAPPPPASQPQRPKADAGEPRGAEPGAAPRSEGL